MIAGDAASVTGPPPLRPYENISTTLPPRFIPDYRSFIEARLAEGYVHEGILLTDLKPPIDWNGSRFSRSHRARLHAWEPIGLVLAAHSQLGDDKYLEIAAEFAFDWLHRFQAPALSQPLADVLAVASSGEEDFVWYDVCVSNRAYRLAYIAEAIVRRGGWTEEDTRLLIDALHFHQRILAQDTIFRAHTNHGLYQALGQLAASRRLTDLIPSEGFTALARGRLETVLAQHFVTEEGVHKEHSPFYQYMLLGTLIGAQEAGLLDLRESGLLDRVSASLSWMIMPDASIVTFGDSDPVRVTEEAPGEQFSDPWLRHQFSSGRIGEPPPSGVKGFPKGGYAFARIYDREAGESPASATYLAQLAAFHSRVHKHADHLTFVWSEGQRQILTDPGRYGYVGRTKRGDGLFEQGFWYADPKRIYVESTRAHNCVEIDGLSYVRRKNRAFGSALKQADFQDGCVVFDSAVTHRPSLVHRRTLILAPREFLVVVDWLFDRSGEAHDFRQWFQLAPVWEAERWAGGFSARCGEARLWAIELLGGADPSILHTGSKEPFQGWTSDAPGSLTPSPSFNFRRSGASTAAFATLFSLTGEPATHALTRVNTSLSRARLVWTSEGRTVQLTLERRDRISVSRRNLHRSRAAREVPP